MSLRTLESAITAEARDVLNNRKLRVKDITEWTTGTPSPAPGEIVVYLPKHGVRICVAANCDKREVKP